MHAGSCIWTLGHQVRLLASQSKLGVQKWLLQAEIRLQQDNCEKIWAESAECHTHTYSCTLLATAQAEIVAPPLCLVMASFSSCLWARHHWRNSGP